MYIKKLIRVHLGFVGSGFFSNVSAPVLLVVLARFNSSSFFSLLNHIIQLFYCFSAY